MWVRDCLAITARLHPIALLKIGSQSLRFKFPLTQRIIHVTCPDGEARLKSPAKQLLLKTDSCPEPNSTVHCAILVRAIVNPSKQPVFHHK